MTNEAYHGEVEWYSKSHLDVVAQTDAHYYAAYLDPNRGPHVPTTAMIQGSAIHTATLEPEKFELEYVVVPDSLPNRPTSRQVNAKKPSAETTEAISAWSEFTAASTGKTILTRDQWDISLAAQASVRKHKRAREILRRGKAEEAYFGIDPDTGAQVKAKPDWRHDDGIADLKSTEDASQDGFYKSVVNFNYHLQPWWYQNAIEAALDTTLPKLWEFIAVEKSPPYAVAVYTLPDVVLRAGAIRAQVLLRRILDAKMLDEWVAYSDDTQTLEFSTWALNKLGANSAEVDFA